jgi:hypothetical protein
MEGKKRHGTRKELAEYLSQNGFPISYQQLTFLSMPSAFQGPPVAYWWGPRAIHDFDAALEWARARAKPTNPREQQQQPAA